MAEYQEWATGFAFVFFRRAIADLHAHCSIGKIGLILLKNYSLIQGQVADSIPVVNGRISNAGTKAGSASSTVL